MTADTGGDAQEKISPRKHGSQKADFQWSKREKIIAGIAYLEQGQQNQANTNHPPIICLHGIGGNANSFQPQLDQLAQHYRVISWTMPGYGHSQPLPATSFTALSQALTDFMDALSISQAHLIGHSIGGMIAQELALTKPERVKSLALLASTSAFGGRDDSFKEKFLAARLRPLNQGQSMAELTQAFVPTLVGSNATPAIIAAAIASMSAIPQDSYRSTLECLVTFNRYYDIARLTLPVCLMAGAEDKTAPPATMKKMAEKMAHAEFHNLAEAGHLLNLEAAEFCNRILHDFFMQQA